MTREIDFGGVFHTREFSFDRGGRCKNADAVGCDPSRHFGRDIFQRGTPFFTPFAPDFDALGDERRGIVLAFLQSLRVPFAPWTGA